MGRSKKLYQLQKIDSAIHTAEGRIAEIEQELAKDEALISAQQAAKKARQKVDAKSKVLKRAEREVKDQERKIKENQKKLYGGNVTNPKELEDLQLESESLQRYLETLEERQLEAMLELDQAEKAYKEAQNNLQKIKDQRRALHKELSQERTALQNDIKSLLEDRQNKVQGIDDADLQHYQDLRDKLGGIAVARINNESCSACGTRVPSAIYQKARSPSQITHCKTCNRILHAD